MPVATSSSTPKSLAPGIYCPVVTFFKDTPQQELDIETHIKHIAFLGRSGIEGVVVQGSTGEAVALTREERMELIRTAKQAFASTGNRGPIIAGTVGAQSLREAIVLSEDAAAAGADYTLVLPPSYYPAAMTPDAIYGFYTDLADVSPIPVLVYSYPGVCSGINMDSDLITRIGRHPNVLGVKHTDHDVGKIARMARAQGKLGSPFTVLGGATDYLLGTVAYGASGAITGLANIAPRVCAKAFELSRAGKTAEALELAQEISTAEWSLGKGNILGTKYATVKFNSFAPSAAICRKPLPIVPDATKKHVESECEAIVNLERQLEKEGWVASSLRGDSSAESVSSKKANGGGVVEKIKQTVGAL